jgi:hypothetical protein
MQVGFTVENTKIEDLDIDVSTIKKFYRRCSNWEFSTFYFLLLLF